PYNIPISANTIKKTPNRPRTELTTTVPPFSLSLPNSLYTKIPNIASDIKHRQNLQGNLTRITRVRTNGSVSVKIDSGNSSMFLLTLHARAPSAAIPTFDEPSHFSSN